MAMESRLLQAGAASPCGFGAAMARRPSALATQKFRVSSQVFFKGAEVRGARDCVATRERRMERSAVSARAGSGSRRPVEQQDSNTTEYIESSSEAHHGSPYIGSPLLWVGVGVGLSALFSFGANSVKRYAMQQMLKSMAGPGGPGGPAGNPFGGAGGNPFAGMPMPPPGAGFPFPMPPSPSPSQVSAAAAAPPVDVAPTAVTSSPPSAKSEVTSGPAEARKSAFTDVNASEILEREQKAAASRAFTDQSPPASEPSRPFFTDPEVMDARGGNNTGGGQSPNEAWTAGGKGKGTMFTVEQLEKMMEDPTVQKMVYPYLPEEMRNPTTFKWMMQNPQYRQQLQDMLNSMGGDGAWDNRMSDMLKNFDLNSTEVKQQFEQIGLTPEEVVAKIMANPEVAVAFQDPKVQAAIMDCSTNPLNITKYQNDKEVMDVFNKISELFPGMTGSPY